MKKEKIISFFIFSIFCIPISWIMAVFIHCTLKHIKFSIEMVTNINFEKGLIPPFHNLFIHPKKHKPCRKKYKAHILKYKALISKYMPCIFREVPSFFFAFRYGVFYNGNFPVSYAVFLFFLR